MPSTILPESRLKPGAGALDVRAGVAQQNAVAVFLRLGFDALHHFGAERVGNVGHHHQDHIAASGAQLTGEQVWLVVALLNRPQNALAIFRLHGVAVIQHAGDRRHGDPGQLSDFLN